MLRWLMLTVVICSGPAAATAWDETPTAADDAAADDAAADDAAADDATADDATADSSDAAAGDGATTDEVADAEPAEQPAEEDTVGQVREQAQELASDTRDKVQEIASTIDQSPTAQEVSAGLLKPVYALAESVSFPAFYWVTFMLMVAGTVSYAFQLVLGKVIVLANGSMNIREIFSDTVGLAISLLGLILTAQAASQNSTFPQSPSSVVSSMVVGLLLGLFLYRWGQAEEVDAARGRKRGTKKR